MPAGIGFPSFDVVLRRLVVLGAFVVMSATASATLAHATSHRLSCTHGASSIGPVQLDHGHVVGTVPAPVTETCLAP
jgi:hypothetical protein